MDAGKHRSALRARRPLRILLITNHRRFKISFRSYPWGRALTALGHEVDVMCHANTERWHTHIERIEGFRIIENPDMLIGALRQGWDPVCAVRRGRFLFREDKRYDIIHCLDTRPAVIWPALRYARAKNIPIVSDWIDWWGRGGLIHERRPWWYRLAFTGVETYFEEHYRTQLDGLTAISHALLERAVKLGVPRERCLHVPGGVSVDTFSDLPSREECKRQVGIPPAAPVICFSGLDVLIDLPLAVAAYEEVRKELPETYFLLTGGATDSRVRSLLTDARAMDQIKVLGVILFSDLPKRLAAADVFILPFTNKVSNIGRWPNKVGDYMGIGRPIVSNAVGEITWLFEKYAVGVLAAETPESMADALLTLLRNPEKAMAMGKEARRVAENHFTWDHLILNLEKWYYGYLDGHGGSEIKSN